jgi:hypothetical protein
MCLSLAMLDRPVLLPVCDMARLALFRLEEDDAGSMIPVITMVQPTVLPLLGL